MVVACLQSEVSDDAISCDSVRWHEKWVNATESCVENCYSWYQSGCPCVDAWLAMCGPSCARRSQAFIHCWSAHLMEIFQVSVLRRVHWIKGRKEKGKSGSLVAFNWYFDRIWCECHAFILDRARRTSYAHEPDCRCLYSHHVHAAQWEWQEEIVLPRTILLLAITLIHPSGKLGASHHPLCGSPISEAPACRSGSQTLLSFYPSWGQSTSLSHTSLRQIEE